MPKKRLKKKKFKMIKNYVGTLSKIRLLSKPKVLHSEETRLRGIINKEKKSKDK